MSRSNTATSVTPPPISLDRLSFLTHRITHLLSTRPEQDANTADLYNALLDLDRVLINLSHDPTSPQLLWIDDVFAALRVVYPILNHPQDSPSPQIQSPLQSDPRRSSCLSLSQQKLHFQNPLLALAPIPSLLRRSVRSLISTQPPPPPQTPHPLLNATKVVNEWVNAIQSHQKPSTQDDSESWLSLSDALPPLPQQYASARDELYTVVLDSLIAGADEAQRSDSPATVAVGLLGPRGVGKTMLAAELVHDPELTRSFADGIAWIQLGPDINDEELADQIIHCVETIIAGDFRSSVAFCDSLNSVVDKAARVLTQVSSLIVVDDVSGPNAQRAFDIVISALGDSCVALYTSPIDEDEKIGETLSLQNVACVARVPMTALPPMSPDAYEIFKGWLKANDSDTVDTPSDERAGQRDLIVKACHGLPLPLAMTAGFLSKFPDCWDEVTQVVDGSPCGDETIKRLMAMLLKKGGPKFQAQLLAITCLPRGVWVSLSALADLWGVDHSAINLKARRLGRLAFAEYRLGDSSDESRVRFHWHILRYCHDMTSTADITAANRKLLSNVSRRKVANGKPRRKSDYVPWWGACMSDKYIRRRLHWHMARAVSMGKLSDLICDFQWVCQRLERDGLVGMGIEFRLGIAAEEREGKTSEAQGIRRMLVAVQEASKLRQAERLEMSALPTFLISALSEHETKSIACTHFLNSIFDKARRPWLRPILRTSASSISSQEEIMPTEDSIDSDAFVEQTNCLAATESGYLVCGDKKGNVSAHDPRTMKAVRSWKSSKVGGHPQSRGVGAIATVKNFVLSGHFNGRLFMRSIDSGDTELLQTRHQSLDKITSIAASEDGIIAVGSHTGQLFVLKGVYGFNCVPQQIDLEGHCDIVTSLLVFPDGRRIASSSHDGFAAVWVLRSTGCERISLNGHKPEIGHKENYITNFATIAGGKRLLSACRGGIVNLWNSETGDCLWAFRFGFEFSCSLSLQSFGVELWRSSMSDAAKPKKLLRVGNPYLISRGPGPEDLLIIAAGISTDIRATVATEKPIASWLEVWHPSTQRIYAVVSYFDGQLGSYELVTSLK